MSGLLTAVGLGIGLAMDAVAVCVASGLAKKDLDESDAPKMAATFGGFQAVMPLIGWSIGSVVRGWVATVDHWIIAAVLIGLGGKMAWEGWRHDPEVPRDDPFAWKALLLTGIATSIDALAVGVTLSLLGLPVVLSALIIGIVTAALCMPAVLFGARLGVRWASRAEVLGGGILICIALKVLAEHLTAAA